MEKVFHNKWWDYSDKPFNIMGYVCLKFSIFWGLACTFIMLIIHPIIYGFIHLIPHIVGVVLLIIIMTGFAIDVVVTVSTIVKFNRRLKVMDDIAAKIKVLSNQIGENIYENVEEALEKEGLAYEEFGGVKPNPRMAYAQEGVEKAIEFGADFLLAVGGGSSIDTAKAN